MALLVLLQDYFRRSCDVGESWFLDFPARSLVQVLLQFNFAETCYYLSKTGPEKKQKNTERMHTKRSTQREWREKETQREWEGGVHREGESSRSSRTKEVVCIIKEQVWRMNIYLKLQQPERWQESKKWEWRGGEEEARSKLELRGGGVESSVAASVRMAERAETWRTQKQRQCKAGALLGLYKACPAQASALPSWRPAPVCLGQLEWTTTNQRS